MNIAKAILLAVHPEYQKRKDDWDFFLQSYEGGSNYFTKENIFTHGRENASDYEWRLKRATYQNCCEGIIGIYTGHLFKKPIIRNPEGDEEFEIFFNDVDRRGHSINDFFKNIADLMQILGHVYILVDQPRTNGETRTAADRQANGVTPYYSVIYPQNCVNWELDADGNFEWVRLMEVLDVQPSPFEKRETQIRYRTFSKEAWWLHDGDGQMIDAGVHELGEVPLIPVWNGQLKRYPLFGWSAIEDIAFINRKLANLSSLLDEFMYRQCFSILIWPDTGATDDETSEGEINLSTQNMVLLPDDVGFTPQFIEPSTAPAEFLMNYMNELRSAIYQLARLEAPDMRPEVASGTSKRWGFHETNQSLADKADNLEEAEINCHRLRALWMDKEWKGVVDYPEEFDIRAVNQELEDALRVKMYGFPPTFNNEYAKQLWRKLLPKVGKDIAVKIDEDIEKGVASMNNVTEAEEETVRRITQRLQEV